MHIQAPAGRTPPSTLSVDKHLCFGCGWHRWEIERCFGYVAMPKQQDAEYLILGRRHPLLSNPVQ
jgi:hypothetical protein